MAVFTTLSSGDDTQDKDVGNEIILAYSEHRQVMGQSSVSAVSTGDDAQYKTLWLAMQAWLEANCTSFVNHNDVPNMFTVATWRTAAGLNASGFSRYQDEALIGYGNITKGDDRDKINFQELQKGFDALRWTKDNVTWTAKGEDSGWLSSTWSWPTWAEAQANAGSNWAVFGVVNTPSAWTRGNYYTDDPELRYNAPPGRSYAYAQASGISTVIQHSAELWMKPKAYSYGNPKYLVFDNNGDIVGSDGMWGLEFSFGESATATHEQKVGDTAFPNWCAAPTADENPTGRGWIVDEDRWLLKWNGANGFSYHL